MNENIEKVLAALDGFRMNDEMTYSAYSVLHDEISLLDDLLKAQEPKQVYITGQTSGIKVGMCPNCGNAISSEGSSHFCGKCGQAVKWE